MALHGGTANVMYLESFVDSTGSLPTELQRILNTIKALDEKCLDLSAELSGSVAALLSLPPALAQPPPPEYDELVSRVGGVQRLLVQFADEKVQLAQQAHDLLEVHALELERVTDDLDKELRRNNPDGGLDQYLDAFGIDAPPGPATGRGKTPRLDDFNLSLQQELQLPAAPPPPPPAPAPKKAAAAVASKGKRPREEDGGAAAGAGPGGGPKKKASVAPLPLTSQPSTFEDYGGLDGGLGAGGYEAEGSAPPAEAPVPFMRPPPAGYKPHSVRPQAATGGLVRYLCDADIKEDLVGRHAELFWPDDNLWYLIEIQEVMPAAKEARVLYSTGDFETLNLEETARDMHMVLIPEQLYV